MTRPRGRSASRRNRLFTSVRTAAHTRGGSAFSLLELLLVLAILLILTVLGTRNVTTSTRKRELTACSANLQKIYLALSFYRNDHGTYPMLSDAQSSAEALSVLVPKSTTETEIFICPASGDKLLPESEPFT